MSNFNIKSIILGMGIGIILTSVLSLIVVAGAKSESKLSKDEIMELARNYGMIDGTALIKDSEVIKNEHDDPAQKIITTIERKPTSFKEQISTTIPTIASTPVPTIDTKVEDIDEKESKNSDSITIYVNKGDGSEIVAQRLKNNGLIDDTNEFLKVMKRMGLESSIIVGEYKIYEGTEYIDIIKLITKK